MIPNRVAVSGALSAWLGLGLLWGCPSNAVKLSVDAGPRTPVIVDASFVDAGAFDAGPPTPVMPLVDDCTPGTPVPNAYTIVSADTDGGVVEELAQTFAVANAGQPGSITLTLELLSNTQLITPDFNMLVDLYDLGPQTAGGVYVVPSPTDPTGACDDLESYGSTHAIARARFNTEVLLQGSSYNKRINFMSNGTAATLLSPGHAYAVVLYMEAPGINKIGISSTSISPAAPQVGLAYQRQESVIGPGCISSAPWVADSGAQVSFCLSEGDGCTNGNAYTCGTGVCFRTIPECDSYGGFNSCVPGYCTTDADCVWDWNNPGRGSYGGQSCTASSDCPYGQTCTNHACTGICNNPTGQEYQGLCQSNPPLDGGSAGVPETCNGIDDDCNGVTDDGLGDVSCGTGACFTSVYSCTDSIGDAGFLAGTPTDCVAEEPAGCADAG